MVAQRPAMWVTLAACALFASAPGASRADTSGQPAATPSSTATQAPPSKPTAKPAAKNPPWLGVGIVDGLYGVRITEVVPETPADNAGIVPGDEIIAVAGIRTATVQDLKMTLARYQVNDRVKLDVRRNGRKTSLSATLAAKLSDSELLYRRLAGRLAVDFDLPNIAASVAAGIGSGLAATSGTGADSPGALGGKVVVVYFFSTQCRECSELHRPLSRLADERGRDGLRVLGVSRESRDLLRTWTRRSSPSFTVLHDTYSEVFRVYRIEREPAIVVINRHGEISYAGVGGGDNLDNAAFAVERALATERHGWAR